MDVKEFEKGILDRLNKLTPEQIDKIHHEFNAKGDWGVTKDGESYWIPPKKA